MNKIGFEYYKFWVCLHERNSYYYKDWRRDLRNSRLDDYYEMINVIGESGGAVLRVGRPSFPCTENISNFYDYSNSEYQNDKLDIALIVHCYFYVGCCSGLINIAVVFQKPLIASNFYSIFR